MSKCVVCKKELEHDNANMCEDCYEQAMNHLLRKDSHEDE